MISKQDHKQGWTTDRKYSPTLPPSPSTACYYRFDSPVEREAGRDRVRDREKDRIHQKYYMLYKESKDSSTG